MANRSEYDLRWHISKRFTISVMESVQFLNILIIFFIISRFSQNIFIVGQIVGEIHPENYKLLFNFSGADSCSRDKCMYNGEVIITMTVAGRANSFSVQSDPETTIDSTKTQLLRVYQNGTRTIVRIIDYIYTRGETSLIIEIRVEQMFQIISESQFELFLYFTRQFNDHRGFYDPSTNPHDDNILMITHLVPNRAHRLFPCLSNQHKWTSSFEITVIYPSKYEVVAGTALIENKEISLGTNMSIYEKTKKMPSEHLFFVIWRYVIHLMGPLTFWFPPDIDQKDFSLMTDYTIKCLRLISNITSTVAPIQPVMNIAPIPSANIMDYHTVPGVLLYKERRVLYNDVESSTSSKYEIITIISRAVASLWIGILIYPKSRSELWIYKALAHYVADFIIDVIEPQFRNRELALARTILWTRSDRDLEASTTIPFYLFDTWDEKMYFRREDYICYQAMTIIAMIHEIYNFEDIGSLIKQALERWGSGRYGPTQQELVSALEREHMDMLIDDWSKMPGIPIVHVALDRSEQHAELIQERFNPSGPWSDDRFHWTIPIRCFNATTKEHYIEWLKPNVSFISTAGHIKNCLLHTDTVVPYRVNYPDKWWLEIIALLEQNPNDIGEMQKMRIIDDMLEFSLAGYIHIEVLLRLLNYLTNEVDYFPWLAGAKAFKKLRAILSTGNTEEHKSYYRQLGVNIVHNVYEHIEQKFGELSDHYLRLHRKNIIDLACGFGHEGCLREAEDQLNCYIHEVSSVDCPNGRCFDRWGKCLRDADERDIMLCQGLRRASTKVWLTALRLLNITNLFPPVHLQIACGLACTENLDILENYVYYMLDNPVLFPSDHIFPILLTAARLSELNAQVVLHFIVKNHGKLVERLELPHEYEKHLYSLSKNMIYPRAGSQKINPQASPLTYAELPDGVQKILEVNTIRASRLRPMIEDYLEDYYRNIEK